MASTIDELGADGLLDRYSLKGQTAVVTGGAKGIGAAIVREFLSLGCRVIVWDMDVSTLETIPGRLEGIRVDVTNQAALEEAKVRTEELIGTPDILVNNAGIQGPTVPLEQYDLASWNRVIAVNLTSVFSICKLFVLGMRERKSGRIINIASVAGIRGLTDGSAYGASKAGVIGLSIGLSKEVVEDGITVNCVAPALIDTDLQLQMSADFIKQSAQRIPMKRLGKAEEVAATVAWIAMPACSFTTGAVFDVAGGRLGL
ncbi:SDR family NAD(P)-dependent oxidoreductase [Microvirga puerhi]|uniref:SDR family oxidoreductase n=1 Tax=Microvirga puerhi TaxID=2876078 RepID=A0ABS7VUV2_9HYPH|nr:SDR family NAD(P)-dependent oxidoreductase [Microvirga puerhi]MBZ6078727.1 SDR family oxidoreductase [Microvirga puerhi]